MKYANRNVKPERENKRTQSTKLYGSKRTGRSKITNGTHLPWRLHPSVIVRLTCSPHGRDPDSPCAIQKVGRGKPAECS